MESRIESAGNGKVKLAASLRQRKHREKTGLFLAEGVRLCEMAAASGWKISFGLYTPSVAGENRAGDLLGRLKEIGCLLYEVPENIFAKASSTESPQGILLVVEQKGISLGNLILPKNPFLMVMDGRQDPGNAGTMIRLADAAGMDGVILLKGSVDVFSDKTVRATMGSVFHLPICSNTDGKEFMDFVREKGIRLYAATLDGRAKVCYEADLSGSIALVFGNEANGVSSDILRMAEGMYIPMFGKAESLNVATAASALVYEAVRQRRYPGEWRRV
ncbi:MAG: RNA methyltransferase [Selenomonadaceae bacterium]|nr:RNA methyltransferase [Selenomonadaceae bacterium]